MVHSNLGCGLKGYSEAILGRATPRPSVFHVKNRAQPPMPQGGRENQRKIVRDVDNAAAPAAKSGRELTRLIGREFPEWTMPGDTPRFRLSLNSSPNTKPQDLPRLTYRHDDQPGPQRPADDRRDCKCGGVFSYPWGQCEKMDAAIEAHWQKFDRKVAGGAANDILPPSADLSGRSADPPAPALDSFPAGAGLFPSMKQSTC